MRPVSTLLHYNHRTMTRRWILAAAAASLVLTAGPARAAILCTISAVSPVTFPAYDVFNTMPTDGQGSVTYSCRGVGQNTVTMDLSEGGSGAFNPRQMAKGSERLAYNLFLDAGRGTIWGNGTGGTGHYGPVQPPNDTPVVVPIFGRIPAGQNVTAGNFGDSVTLTLNF